MTNPDPYMLLGIQRDASSEDIRRAFQNLYERIHPSKNPIAAAHTQFTELKQAFDLLSDPIMKRRIDDARNLRKETPHDFGLRITPSKRIINILGEQQVMYLLAEIIPPANAAEILKNRQVQLNLTLVIDQSKSMEDERRIEKVRAAAQTIITGLTNRDVISIIAFNDRADIIIPATQVVDKMALRARVSMIKPRGATAIFEGLSEGIKQCRKNNTQKMVSHVILLTDGRTYGDEDKCIELARRASLEGITISALGMGTDWNDRFLDQLASITGGTSTYIRSVNMVTRFLDEHLRAISSSYAERVQISVVPDPDIKLDMAFKLSPQAQPLEHTTGIFPLAGLPANRPITLLLQLQLPANLQAGYRSMVRFVATGDIIVQGINKFTTLSDVSIDVSSVERDQSPTPAVIVDALSKLTLYRLQEKAQEAIERGDIQEATRRLQFLATRLFDIGEETLGQQALSEADHVMKTRSFSDESSKKTIKYSTRALVGKDGMRDALTMLFNQEDDAE
jgi:Ca-activated chloride channel family protein